MASATTPQPNNKVIALIGGIIENYIGLVHSNQL
jgi:hypothetical protein